jgi:hypothetical protein
LCHFRPIWLEEEAKMADATCQRFVLLNRLVSRSATRAPEEHKPPTIPGYELFAVIQGRHQKRWTIEFPRLPETEIQAEKGEAERIARGRGYDFISLRQITIDERPPWKVVTMLLEYVDASKRSFSVVHTTNFTGREISGVEDERGSRSAHIVVRLPTTQYDDGTYRCAIEHLGLALY